MTSDTELISALQFSPDFVKLHLPAKMRSEAWQFPVMLGACFLALITYVVPALALFFGVWMLRWAARWRRSGHLYRALGVVLLVGRSLVVMGLAAIPIFVLETVRFNLTRLKRFIVEARRYHAIAVDAVASRQFILVLRDFDNEASYDFSPIFLGLALNLRKDLLETLCKQSREMGLSVVTLANPHYEDILDRADTGVHQLFIDPNAWHAAVEHLVAEARFIVILMPAYSLGAGLSFELDCIAQSGRMPDSVAIVIGDEDDHLPSTAMRNHPRVVEHHSFVRSANALRDLMNGPLRN